VSAGAQGGPRGGASVVGWLQERVEGEARRDSSKALTELGALV
jgi:hypothetical protein